MKSTTCYRRSLLITHLHLSKASCLFFMLPLSDVISKQLIKPSIQSASILEARETISSRLTNRYSEEIFITYYISTKACDMVVGLVGGIRYNVLDIPAENCGM